MIRGRKQDDYAIDQPDYAADFAGAQTNTVIAAAPGAGRRLVVRGYRMRANAAVNCDLHDEDDTPVSGTEYLTAKDRAGGPIRKYLAENKALEFTSNAAVAHSLLVWVDVVDVPQAI